MAKGQKTGGRQKGTPNKTTQDVKSAIEAVAAGLGGADRMLAWCREDEVNERIFWSQIYPKILPKEIKGEVAHVVTLADLVEAAQRRADESAGD